MRNLFSPFSKRKSFPSDYQGTLWGEFQATGHTRTRTLDRIRKKKTRNKVRGAVNKKSKNQQIS